MSYAILNPPNDHSNICAKHFIDEQSPAVRHMLFTSSASEVGTFAAGIGDVEHWDFVTTLRRSA